MILELDGARMTDRAALHDHLTTALSLPEGYGRNLDALYDLLTERGDTIIVLKNRAQMEAQLGRYGLALLRVLEDAAQRNPGLTVVLE